MVKILTFLGQEQDSYLSDSSSHSKSRSSGTETSKLPQPNWTRNRSAEKNREESGISRSPSLSSTAEEKPPTGRKIEEPKLVTIRSIAPITAGIAIISETPRPQYPIRKIDSSDQGWWLQDSEQKENSYEESTSNKSTSIDNDLNMNNTSVSKIPSYNLRKMDSSDRNRWLQEAGQANHNEGSLSGTESNSRSESTKSTSISNKNPIYSIRKMDSSDRNVWLQEAAQEDNIVENQKSCTSSNSESIRSNTLSSISPTHDIKRTGTTNKNLYLQDSEKQELNIQNSISYVDNVLNGNSCTENSLSTKNPTYCVRKMDSFDTPWWLKEEKTSCASDESKLSSNKVEFEKSDHSLTKSPEMTVSYGVRKMDSFDSPWWLSGDEAKQVNSSSDISNKNQRVENEENVKFKENPNGLFPINTENEVNMNLHENQWWLKPGTGSQLETDLTEVNGNSIFNEVDNNYLDSTKLEPWDNEYPSIKKIDSSESQWWGEDQKNTDARSTSISIDWSRDDPESYNQIKINQTGSPLENIPDIRKMGSFDSPSWLASEESESQSHEPKNTSSGDVVSSSSKPIDELVDSSPDWWGEKNESDDFVRTKRTSLRIKKIENVVNESVDEPTNTAPKEPNLQDELDQLMLFIGGCRNIDELLGNEEPPPAAPTTPPDTDSGNIISLFI